MSRATRETAATRSLRTRVDTKATGRLVLAGDLAVHLLHGDILAATCPDDDGTVVRMLHLRGLVDDRRAEELETLASAGGDVFGEILALGLGVQVDPILRDRFVQNLCDFVIAPGTPKWIEQKGVFVANIQMGHVTPSLVDEVCRLADLAKAVDPAARVIRGPLPPGPDPLRTLLYEALSTDPRSIDSLLAELPVEPTRGRVVLAEMLLDGVATQHTDADLLDEDDTLMTAGRPSAPPSAIPRTTAPPPAPRSSAPPATPRSAAPGATGPAGAVRTGPPVAPRTEAPKPDPRAPAGAEGKAPGRSTAPPAPARDEKVPARTELPKVPPGRTTAPPAPARDEKARTEPGQAAPSQAAPSQAAPSQAAPSQAAPSQVAPPKPPPLSATPESLPEVEPEPLSEDGDVVLPEPLSEDGDVVEVSRTAGAGPPRSLSDYLSKTAAVADDDLDFFSDHDYERGGEADGRFKTERANLDKVDVGGQEDEAIEVDEAPSTRFGAPPLSEEEAYSKIEVANEVLQTIVSAFDEAEGSGRGRALVQLLVDGVPSQFAPLLHDLRIDDDGELPARVLIRNLADRPPTEHRQLLNNSLADIIERALSSAADELPDEQIDQVLESVAGYRSRLGL